MSLLQGIPGPWFVDDDSPHGVWIITSSNSPIAKLESHAGLANACLISAAPELLSALQIAIDYMRNSVSSGRQVADYRRARAAIAKALGL